MRLHHALESFVVGLLYGLLKMVSSIINQNVDVSEMLFDMGSECWHLVKQGNIMCYNVDGSTYAIGGCF